jgi:hypothetical protein
MKIASLDLRTHLLGRFPPPPCRLLSVMYTGQKGGVKIQHLGAHWRVREELQRGASLLQSWGGIVDVVRVAKGIRPQMDVDR